MKQAAIPAKKRALLLILLFAIINITKAQWSYICNTSINGFEVSTTFNNGDGSICIDQSGNVYAAIDDYQNSPVSYSYQTVAKWSGTSWEPLGGANWFDFHSHIYAMCSDGLNNIYAAGDFVNSSGRRYVAKWDGNSWSELGGLNGLSANAAIYSICSDVANNIYAFGKFTDAGNRYYVAKWNGSSWSQLGDNSFINSSVPNFALCSDPYGNIYAAGAFTNNNGKRYVAKWDGAAWSELGGIDGLAANGDIRSLCSDPYGRIYASGLFRNSSDKYYVAIWNGANWSELSGINYLNSDLPVSHITCDAYARVYASAGNYGSPNLHTYIARFDGASWSELGTAISIFATSYLKVCCIPSGNVVYTLTGDHCVEKYCTPANSTSNIAVCSRDLPLTWNGNTYTTAGTYTANLTSYYGCDSTAILNLTINNTCTWKEVGSINALAANNIIRSVIKDAAGNIYAAGNFTNSSGKQYIAKWDGNNWSELGGLNGLSANSTIFSLCTGPGGNIYAAGEFTNGVNLFSGKRYVAKWDGNNWSELGGINALAANGLILSVCSDGTGNIYAAGQFTNSFGKRYVAKWDGTSWSELGGANALGANGAINALCADAAGNIYAAGQFTNGPDQFSGKQYVAKWDGTTWTELGGVNALSANNHIYTLCIDGANNIYAGGYFTNNLGKRYVAKWDGTAWTELGGANSLAANSTIWSVQADAAGNIYAGGYFVNSTGRWYVARYDGTGWVELGGLNGLSANFTINSICTDADGSVYAGGDFYNSSNKSFVAKYAEYVSVQNGDWNNPATWAKGEVPPADANVIIKNIVTVTANASCNSVFTKPGGNIIVNTGVLFNVGL